MQSYKILCYFCDMKVSNSIIKLVSSLDKAKTRRETNLFVAEGTKCVCDLMRTFNVRYLIATELWMKQNEAVLTYVDSGLVLSASPKDMERMSHLSTASGVIAVFDMPKIAIPDPTKEHDRLILMLDDVRDPGNLGTIIRAADWFGIRNVVCSNNSVDVYNTKVVMATMGALARVEVSYCDIDSWLAQYNGSVYGTFLEGEDIYRADLKQSGVIVMGNEGKGVRDSVSKKCTHKLFIPPYPAMWQHQNHLTWEWPQP